MKAGTLIGGKYRLLEPIGEGAMGAVWSARNEFTQRLFAVKLLAAQNVGGEEARKRLLREASASGQLMHRNVVEVYDVGVTDTGDPFLVMQLLKGESLDDVMDRSGSLTPERTVEILASVARALEVAHAAGIVHRDLKPGNVFLHQDPDLGVVVKVLDFGVSKVLSGDTSSTLTGTAIGSPAYMSPEQAKGEKTLDQRSDLWALGVMLFEMLSGARPFRGETPYAVVSEILTGRIPSLTEVAPAADSRLVELVGRCLERDVERRIGSARAVLSVLDSIRGPRAQFSSLPGSTGSETLPTHPEAAQAAPAAARKSTEQRGEGPDPTHTSTSALVRSSRGRLSLRSWKAGGGVIAAATARVTSTFSRLTPKTRLAVLATAGVLALLATVILTARSGDGSNGGASLGSAVVEPSAAPSMRAAASPGSGTAGVVVVPAEVPHPGGPPAMQLGDLPIGKTEPEEATIPKGDARTKAGARGAKPPSGTVAPAPVKATATPIAKPSKTRPALPDQPF